MGMPFALAGELDEEASAASVPSRRRVYLADFTGSDPEGLAQAVNRLRAFPGTAERLETRALLLHPRIMEGYRLNLRLHRLLSEGKTGSLPSTPAAPLAAGVTAESTAGKRDGGPSDMLLESALRAGALLYENVVDTLLLLPGPDGPGNAGVGFRRARGAVSSLHTVMGELGVVSRPYTLVSCPTCGRCLMDIPFMARKTERMLRRVTGRFRRAGRPVERAGGITVAVMGCNVNGPGETRAADVGIAGGRGKTGTLFKNGRPVVTLPERKLMPALREQVTEIIEEKLRRVPRS
jgi:4-hydroxy-3-methylbut-2-en-1-yl diphosphate synthase IspG/GcpE